MLSQWDMVRPPYQSTGWLHSPELRCLRSWQLLFGGGWSEGPTCFDVQLVLARSVLVSHLWCSWSMAVNKLKNSVNKNLSINMYKHVIFCCMACIRTCEYMWCVHIFETCNLFVVFDLVLVELRLASLLGLEELHAFLGLGHDATCKAETQVAATASRYKWHEEKKGCKL